MSDLEGVLSGSRSKISKSFDTRKCITTFAAILLVIVFYSVGYWRSPERPDDSPQHQTEGWKAWWDQGNYYRSVTALNEDDYKPSEHHYPIGYALLGTIFSPLMPEQPFFVPDLLCYIAMAIAFLKICQLFVSPQESLLLCFFALIWPVAVRVNLIRPWTNTPVSAALLVLTLLALSARRDRTAAVLTGACASLIFAVRPGDILFSWPLMTALWLDSSDWRAAWHRASWFIVGASPLSALTVYYSLAIHGGLVSAAYRHAVEKIGFSVAPLGLKLFTLLINAYPLFGETRTWINVFPIFLFALPGLAYFVKTFRWRAAPVLATQAGAVLYFLFFNDFWVSNLFRGGSVRYVLWLIPLGCLFAYLSFRLAWRRLSWPTYAMMLGIPILAWILPQMTIRPVPFKVSKDYGTTATCAPDGPFACNLYLSLSTPVEFDILQLQGTPAVTLTYATAWIGGHANLMFRDFYISDAPGGKTDLIFYKRQRGDSIKLTVPTLRGEQPQFSASNFWLGVRRSGLALRNPFLRYHPN